MLHEIPSIIGEQLVLVARAYEELLGQLSPTASYNYVAFQVEQQLIEFCFEHLLHIIAQPLIYSRSRVNVCFTQILLLIYCKFEYRLYSICFILVCTVLICF